MYYLIEVSETAEAAAKAIWDKATLNEATMQLHQTLASAMANEAVRSCLCMIVDARGAVMRHEYWERTA